MLVQVNQTTDLTNHHHLSFLPCLSGIRESLTFKRKKLAPQEQKNQLMKSFLHIFTWDKTFRQNKFSLNSLQFFELINSTSLDRALRIKNVILCEEEIGKSCSSSHVRCSIEKSVLKHFAKFTGKHLCQTASEVCPLPSSWILWILFMTLDSHRRTVPVSSMKNRGLTIIARKLCCYRHYVGQTV